MGLLTRLKQLNPITGRYIRENGRTVNVADMVDAGIAYQTGVGTVYVASDRATLAAGASEYYELRVPLGRCVRAYNRTISVGGGDFEVDLVDADFTPGTTEIVHSPMNRRFLGPPEAKIYKGVTGVTNESILEYGYIPAEEGKKSPGSIGTDGSFRVFCEGESGLLRITNTNSETHVYNFVVLYSDRPLVEGD